VRKYYSNPQYFKKKNYKVKLFNIKKVKLTDNLKKKKKKGKRKSESESEKKNKI